uniref:Uncharacterized protein n=1 Tax=Cyanothece sp. (strain PCC 7425 / ATCC 29141) TaxID=395961 RepID=B8HRZ3_CYAP4
MAEYGTAEMGILACTHKLSIIVEGIPLAMSLS